MSPQFDVIVVGSGPAGIQAAYPLINAGLKVAIIDAGLDSKKEEELHEFSTAHLTKKKHYYDILKKRGYVFNKTYDLLRIKSNVDIIQSLAKGGLSEIWHGICEFFTEDELNACGLPAKEILNEYEKLSKNLRLRTNFPLNSQSKLLLKKSKKNNFFKNSIYQVPLVLSYRTSSIVDQLKKFKNFNYISNHLVVTISEKSKYVEIKSLSLDKKKEHAIYAKYIILAAGSINTTRILLRSLKLYNYNTPFLTKANYVIVCLQIASAFKKKINRKSTLGQLVISSHKMKETIGSFFIQLYSFNPLMLHAALKYIPLPKFISLPALSIIAPTLLLVDIRFPGEESKKKFMRLKKIAKDLDILEITYKETAQELKDHNTVVKMLFKNLWSLGLIPLKTIFGYTSSHYAGGVPISESPKKLSSDKNGRLHNFKRIYIADSSTWKKLPEEPPTFTIMANATRVSKNVLRKIKPYFLDKK